MISLRKEGGHCINVTIMYRLNRLVSRNTQDLKTLAKALRSVQQAQYSNKSSLSGGDEINGSVNETKPGNAFPLAPIFVDREISLFGPKDLRAPLPGNIGLIPSDPVNRRKDKLSKSLTRGDVFSNTDILTGELSHDRHVRVTDQAFYPQFSEMSNESIESSELKSTDVMECIAHQCPTLLAKDFQGIRVIVIICHSSLTNVYY